MSGRSDERQETKRGTGGRFAPGTAPGPGRPPKSGERAYVLATAEACTLADWRAIVRAAVKRAKSGDDKARAFLTRILLGGHPPALSWVLRAIDLLPESAGEV